MFQHYWPWHQRVLNYRQVLTVKTRFTMNKLTLQLKSSNKTLNERCCKRWYEVVCLRLIIRWTLFSFFPHSAQSKTPKKNNKKRVPQSQQSKVRIFLAFGRKFMYSSLTCYFHEKKYLCCVHFFFPRYYFHKHKVMVNCFQNYLWLENVFFKKKSF
jgi:hypothetical protein